jgi:hypothetical protein
MKTDSNIAFACTEEFAELCALSTAGVLSVEECARLEKHVADCPKCARLLAQYRAFTSVGMPKLGAEFDSGVIPTELEVSWPHEAAKHQLLEKLRKGELEATMAEVSFGKGAGGGYRAVPALRHTVVRVLGIAAVLVLGLAVGYRLGDKSSHRVETAAKENSGLSIEEDLRAAQAQRDAANAELAMSAKNIADLAERFKRSESELAELKARKASLEAKAQQADATNQEQTDSLASLARQRETLERRLAETEQSLENVKANLDSLQKERREGQLRTASLETRIDELATKLRDRDEAAKRDEEFLASDRDVRELMGARQLYIADVTDVDQNGSKRQPFGRVFYTKGKSLIFYAFDLDQQPAYRNAKAPASKTFEVWGTGGQDNAKPVGLGVFYLDSETNRRWVFKSDDPNVLAQVNAVFVTVESNDGSKAPSGKPFLYAYLRTAPANHP